MMSDRTGRDPMLPAGYSELLDDIKAQVRSSRVRAARAVNSELVVLYWQIGQIILDRRAVEGWGTSVIGQLATDLRTEFPTMRGLSRRNLFYMRSFAVNYGEPIVQQPVALLPWGHLTLLLDRLSDPSVRDWYVAQAVEHGWSRTVLTHHIAAARHLQTGAAPNNFPRTLPPADSELAQTLARDPYDLDFLALDPGHSERELEDALVTKLTSFIAELGAGFAFVGRQYRLPIGDREFFLDLLFYHLGLRRFIVFELKVGAAEPEHLGKLNFYVNAVDELLRRPERGDDPTIGILLTAARDDVVVEYALRGIDTPLAISTYTTHRDLPVELRPALPSAEQLTELVRDVQRHQHPEADRPR